MRRFWNSSAYQCREKPFHTALLLPALKEKMMRMKIGAYRNTNTNAMKMRFSQQMLPFHSITACSSPSPKRFITSIHTTTMAIITSAIAAPSWGL